MLTLRPYESADAKIILSWIRSREDALRWSVDRYDRYPILPEDMNHKYIDCHGDCLGPEWFFPVTAIDEDKVVGHLILRYPDADKRTVRLGFVIVDRDCRRKGYGKAMLKLALGFAFRQLKAEKVTLGVLANNPDAYHCYKSVGFEDVTAEVPEYYDFLGEPVKCLELEMERKT